MASHITCQAHIYQIGNNTYKLNIFAKKCLTYNTAFHKDLSWGPSYLLYIYINDFPNASTLVQFIMYADDTTLSCCVDTIQSNDKDGVINTELSKVNNWLVSNILSLNINKRKKLYAIS